MHRILLLFLLAAAITALPVRAQLLADIVDNEATLQAPHAEVAGKRLVTSTTSLPVFATFTGLAFEVLSHADALEGRVRMEDVRGWSDWVPLHFVRSFTEDFFITGFHGEAVWSSTRFEVEVTGPLDAPVRLGHAGVFDNRQDDDRLAPKEVHQAPKTPLKRADNVIVPPPLVTRADWNAAPFIGNPVPLANPTYDYMTFHHAAGYSATTYEEGLAQVKAIQDLHQNVRGWSDIGYQFLVDRAGRVYQGRPFLDSSTTLAQEPVMALGAHVGEHNTGNIGICMLGCYHPPEGSYCEQIPTPESIDTYVTLFAFFSERYGPTPSSIRGHRDWSSTACPGDNNYVLIPSIKEDVSTLLVTGNQAIATADLSASQGEDGLVTLTWEFTGDFGVQNYRLERTFEGAKTLLAAGDGAVSGAAVDPGVTGAGTISYELYVSSQDGRTQRVGSTEVQIDLPDTFLLTEAFPNPTAGSATVRLYVPYDALVRIHLFDGAGRLVRTLQDGFERAEEWVVASADVTGLASGMYYYRVQVEGFAGKVFDETRGLIVLH